jgi:hypothetical protein
MYDRISVNKNIPEEIMGMKRNKRKRFGAIKFFLFLLVFSSFSSTKAFSATTEDLTNFLIDHYNLIDIIPDIVSPELNRAVLAKTVPDECFVSVGDPGNTAVPPCAEGSPKANQAYVWGLTKSGDNLWYGTAPNTLCLVLGGYFQGTQPLMTPSFVCEFGQSQYEPIQEFLDDFPLIGDWRPPEMFRYNTQSGQLEDMRPAVFMQEPDIYKTTLGIRSAGAVDDIVFLAGQALTGGVNFFAFDSQGNFLGATNIAEYSIIRKWRVVDGVLYTTVGTQDGGLVLRWTGTVEDPFQFDPVGELDSAGAELVLHEGRLFVSTWPGGELAPQAFKVSGLYMSPVIPEGGLTATNSGPWEKVWQATDYEADPVTAMSYGMGAIASFDGYLYWGTMHVPLLSTMAHFRAYGQPEGENALMDSVLGTYRAISIFRGKDFGTPEQNVDILYGMEEMPVYQPSPEPIPDPPSVPKNAKAYTGGSWVFADNNMGKAPIFGSSGFSNPFNNYTWTMAVFENKLYIGTMDWSYLASDGLTVAEDYIEEFLGEDIELPIDINDIDLSDYWGADLMVISASGQAAEPEDLKGVGNYTNYGIRTMLSDDALYIGMANPMNLLTNPDDNLPEGGWELLKLTPLAGGGSSGGGNGCFIFSLDHHDNK